MPTIGDGTAFFETSAAARRLPARRERLRRPRRHRRAAGAATAWTAGDCRETRTFRSPSSTSISVRFVSFRMPARSRISCWSIPVFFIAISKPFLCLVGQSRAASACSASV